MGFISRLMLLELKGSQISDSIGMSPCEHSETMHPYQCAFMQGQLSPLPPGIQPRAGRITAGPYFFR